MSVFTKSIDFSTYNTPMNITLESNTRNVYSESYFASTCDFLVDINEEYNHNTKVLYKSLLESGNDQMVITESFDEFFDKAKDIIDKVIEFIKSLVKRFITALNKLISNDNYIKKHKGDFSHFSSDNDFSFDGYNYTFKPNIPSLNALESFSDEFMFGNRQAADNLKKSFEKMNSQNIESNGTHIATEEVINSLSKYYQKLTEDLEHNYYDRFRGKVLDKDELISSNEYANELFSVYRDGTSDTESIDVNSTYVHNSIDRYMNYNKAISEIKKYQSNVEKEYKALKNSIEEMQKTNYKDGKSSVSILFPGEETPINVTYSNELMNSINTWCKAKVNQVQEITNIHSLAFSAKLDAVNNCYKQDKAVLYQALNNMQKTTKIKEDAELSYIFGKNEQPEIKVSDSLVNYKDKGELYDTPLRDDDIKEKEPARISQFSSLIKDLKLK